MSKRKIECFIACSCHSEGIYLVKQADDDFLYLSFFSQGINPKRFNWRDKCRYIWNVLKHGKPFEDELVMDKLAVAKLKKILNKI
ncbi:hypothetical protein EBR43_11550 [bacterium]|nr:hypothetical protein [bacterium]